VERLRFVNLARVAARLLAVPTEEPGPRCGARDETVPRCAVRHETVPRCAVRDVEERRCAALGAEPRSEAWGAEPQCAALGEARPSSEAVQPAPDVQVAARAVQAFCSPVQMLRLWPARAKQE
jgi:hypothetical protein